MDEIKIAPVGDADFDDWVAMALELWPTYDRTEMERILRDFAASDREDAFICRAEDGSPVGFCNLSVRSDYVEGSKTSPVGFVEGIFVRDAYRGRGIGRMLIAAGERWTRERGMTELGSDAEIENARSHAFHTGVGFSEAGRSVWFIKKL